MRIKNWEEFQHFKDRNPIWIKLYRKLLDDKQWYDLDPAAAKLLVMLWLLASENQGELPTIPDIAFRLRLAEKHVSLSISRLSHWLIQDDIKMISGRYQDDILETETETESETESERELETDQETETDPAISSQSLTVDRVVEGWNAIPGIIPAQSITGPIKKRLAARIREHPDGGWWVALFARVRASEFLTGRSKTEFAATLDWVLGPKNLAKIEAGNYDTRKKHSNVVDGIQDFLKGGHT